MKRLIHFAALAACFASASLAAQGQFKSTETTLQWEAVEKEGAEYRRIYADAISAAKLGNTDQARDYLEQIIRFCESKESSGTVRVVSFSSPDEFAEYVTAAGQSDKIVWVDLICPASLKMRAFMHADAGEYEEALARLGAATEMAPFWAEPHAEIGYILNQLREFKAARVAYERACELANAHASSAYVKPLALRGLGFTLIELGELDAAQRAFEESLIVEPGNDLAESELRYIEGLRKNSN